MLLLTFATGNNQYGYSQAVFELQNPDNCAKARKLLCGQRARCGLGCELHHIGICLFLALGTNRTLVLDTDASTNRLLERTFLPLSGTCYGITAADLDEAVTIKGYDSNFM